MQNLMENDRQGSLQWRDQAAITWIQRPISALPNVAQPDYKPFEGMP